MFQEYADAPNSWGVRVIKLRAPPPATPSLANPSVVPAGSAAIDVAITGTSIDGSEFFDPGPDRRGPGFPNHLSASVSGGVRVRAVRFDAPTKITLRLDTTAATTGTKDVTVTNPDGQSATGAALILIPQRIVRAQPRRASVGSRLRRFPGAPSS